MAIMNRCCCCDVRTGSIVIAVWTAIGGVASLILNIRAWTAVNDEWNPDSVLPSPSTNYSTFVAFYCISVIVAVLFLLSGISLMFGVIREMRILLLPYVIFQLLVIVVYFIIITITVVLIINGNILYFPYLNALSPSENMSLEDFETALKIAYGCLCVAYLIAILIDILCLLCVVSFYQQLRDGCCSGDRAVLVVNQGGCGNQQYYPSSKAMC